MCVCGSSNPILMTSSMSWCWLVVDVDNTVNTSASVCHANALMVMLTVLILRIVWQREIHTP